jgi:hypothetical protein
MLLMLLIWCGSCCKRFQLLVTVVAAVVVDVNVLDNVFVDVNVIDNVVLVAVFAFIDNVVADMMQK